MKYFLFFLVCIPQFIKAQSCSGHWVNSQPVSFQCIVGQFIGTMVPGSDPVGCPINPIYSGSQSNTFIFDNPVNDFFIDIVGFSSAPGCARMQIKINGVFFPLSLANLSELPSGTSCTGSLSFLTITADGFLTTSPMAAANSNGQARLIFSGVNASSITVSTNDSGGGSAVANPCFEPLPVQIKSFKGYATGNCEVKLQFESGIESNVRNIEIEGSFDGIAFSKLLELFPQGSDSRYVVQIKTSGNNFYRLKINDLDGRFSYSEIIRINNNCVSSTIRISPNPSAEKIWVENIQRDDQLIIVDVLGREVFRLQVTNSSEEINVQHLPSGMYFIKVFKQHAKPETTRFLKS